MDNLNKLMIVSTLSSITSSLLTHPIDVMKVRIQNNTVRLSGVSLLSTICKNEGLRFMYKGMYASILRNGTFVTSKMCMYHYLDKKYNPVQFKDKVLCGIAAGALGSCIGSPFDVVLVKMQSKTKEYNTLKSSFKDIYKEGGLLGFYSGFKFTLCRAIIVTSCQFSVFQQIKEELTDYDDISKFIISSVTSSCVTSIVSNPVDVCKTRTINNVYPNAILNIIKKEGLFALWKGVNVNMCRQIPLNIIRFGCFEMYSKFIFGINI